jgi:hypothetical protein
MLHLIQKWFSLLARFSISRLENSLHYPRVFRSEKIPVRTMTSLLRSQMTDRQTFQSRPPISLYSRGTERNRIQILRICIYVEEHNVEDLLCGQNLGGHD